MRALVADALDQFAEPVDLGVIEPARRLVEQQELRPRRERARKLDALLHAERQIGDAAVRDVAEIEKIDQLPGDVGERLLLAPRPGKLERIAEEIGCGRADGCRRARCRAPTWCGTARGSGTCGRCRSRRCGAAAGRGCCAPRTRCRPRPACRGGEKQLNSVVLPAPFGPIRPSRLPSAMVNDTLSSATMPPKRTETSRTSISGAADTRANARVPPSRRRR